MDKWRLRTLTKLWAVSFAALATSSASAWAQPFPSPPATEPGHAVPSFVNEHGNDDDSSCRLSDEAIGIQPIPDRPPLLFEYNDYFLSPGFLSQGVELPTGEIVRPSVWVFGVNQFAYQYFNNKWNPQKADELVDRLDIFTQLNLSATERVVAGFSPFDRVDNQPHSSKQKYTEVDFQDGRFINGTTLTPLALFSRGTSARSFRAWTCTTARCSTTVSRSAGSRC